MEGESKITFSFPFGFLSFYFDVGIKYSSATNIKKTVDK